MAEQRSRSKLPGWGLIAGLVASVLAAPAAAELTLVERKNMGPGLHAIGPAWHDGTLHVGIMRNVVVGHGQGEDFEHWHQPFGQDDWTKRPLSPEHMPAMVTIMPLGDEERLFLYVDRRDKPRVYLIRERGQERTTLLAFDDGRHVLNPVMNRLPDGNVYVLIPNRGGHNVRRFLVDLASNQVERLPDVKMPKRGARIFGRLVDEGRLLVPLAVRNELLMMTINLDDHSYELQSLDRFSSASDEPPREMQLFPQPGGEQYVLLYLRPAEFSDRVGKKGPATGLIGQLIVALLDSETFEIKHRTVVAGHTAERAATHNFAATMTSPRDLLIAHSEVDRIHTRHMTGEYKNYVGGYVTHWRIEPDASPTRQARQETPPFWRTGTNMIPIGQGEAIFFYNEARNDAPLIFEHWRITPGAPASTEDADG